MTTAPDIAVLHLNGRLTYENRLAGESTYRAMASHIDDVSSQGMGRLRVWFSDTFGDRPANPLADRVLSAIGYHHPTGWRGTVALSMAEDATGECPPLSAAVIATLDDLTRQTAS